MQLPELHKSTSLKKFHSYLWKASSSWQGAEGEGTTDVWQGVTAKPIDNAVTYWHYTPLGWNYLF